MATIALEDLRFFAFHGLYPEEQQEGNHFQVDVYLNTGDRPLPEQDEIGETLDYTHIFKVIQEVMEVRANLLETLLNRIGTRMVKELEGFEEARVRITKHNPPLGIQGGRSYVEAVFKVP